MSDAVARKLTTEQYITTIIRTEKDEPALKSYPPFPAEDVLGGNPNGHKGIVLFRDPLRRFSVGIWECPPGKFVDRQGGCEFSHVLRGSATLTHEATGESKTIRAGDHFYTAFGETIVWDVHEPIKKYYVVYEHDWNDKRFY
jgi:uncharacterized cupin superfamily protein